tara:strand:+ start:58 stop:213 length:156 start_codon:yes stop_codon:yes gene_type:complete
MDKKEGLFAASCFLFCFGGVVLATTKLEWLSWCMMATAVGFWFAALYRGLK